VADGVDVVQDGADRVRVPGTRIRKSSLSERYMLRPPSMASINRACSSEIGGAGASASTNRRDDGCGDPLHAFHGATSVLDATGPAADLRRATALPLFKTRALRGHAGLSINRSSPIWHRPERLVGRDHERHRRRTAPRLMHVPVCYCLASECRAAAIASRILAHAKASW